jgi:hypothetical protein
MKERHEIDLTVKLIDTSRGSVLAIAGPVHNYAVMLTAEVKMELVQLSGRESPKRGFYRSRAKTNGKILHLS